jgi:flavin-binding protein dodecin
MVIKVVELVGSSPTSWEDAVRETVREAARSLRHIKSVEVVKQSAHVDERGTINEYRVTLHIAFAVEHHSHLIGAGAESAQTVH